MPKSEASAIGTAPLEEAARGTPDTEPEPDATQVVVEMPAECEWPAVLSDTLCGDEFAVTVYHWATSQREHHESSGQGCYRQSEPFFVEPLTLQPMGLVHKDRQQNRSVCA